MTKLLLDLDGTLIDPRRRLYELFCELAPRAPWPFDEYWHLKRAGVDQKALLIEHLGFSAAEADRFRSAWMAKIEEPERLALDHPFEGVADFLAAATNHASLFLVTARQHPERMIEQLARWNWRSLFSDLFVTRQRQSKAALVRECLTTSADDLWVGDSGEDIQAGRELGMRTVAVTSGASSAAILQKYHPDRILGSVVDLTLS